MSFLLWCREDLSVETGSGAGCGCLACSWGLKVAVLHFGRQGRSDMAGVAGSAGAIDRTDDGVEEFDAVGRGW